MAEQLIFIGTYAIPEGKYDEFNAGNSAMADYVKENEPRLVSWHTYINKERTLATTMMVHPDSESLEYHMQVAASKIQSGAQTVQVSRIELYGNPSDRLLEQLQRVSDMSGSWPVIVKSHLRGFPD